MPSNLSRASLPSGRCNSFVASHLPIPPPSSPRPTPHPPPPSTPPRFCNSTLDDWKASLTPKDLAPEVSKVQPIMVVYFEGQIHRIPVKQGPDGLQEFQTQIRDLFRCAPLCAAWGCLWFGLRNGEVNKGS